MKNKTLRILNLALAVTTTLSASTPVFAYDVDEHDNSIESVEYQSTEDENFSNAVNVFAQLGSEYKVTVPKTVVLSGASKDARYYVKVAGDIAGYEKVSVVPEDSFKLSAKNKADETAIVNQDKTVWTVHDFDTDANGFIEASSITAGSWEGTFNFDIKLEDSNSENYEALLNLEPGLYDKNNKLVMSWEEIEDFKYGTDIRVDKYKDDANSGYNILNSNSRIERIVLPAKYSKIAINVFRECKNLKAVVLPDGIKDIDSYAFADCTNLEFVKLPNTLEKIGNNAFNNCTSLYSIQIPESVNFIGSTAFEGCKNLKEINVSSDNNYFSSDDGVLFNKNKSEILTYPLGKSFDVYTLPESVTVIGASAFRGHTSLKSIGLANSGASLELPSALVEIDTNAFRDCKNLNEIVLPDSIQNIGISAFSNCSNITSIKLPESLKSLEPNVFYECSSLKNVTLNNSLTSIGNFAFYNCLKLESIEIPYNVKSIGLASFEGCNSLNTVTFQKTGGWTVKEITGSYTKTVDLSNNIDNVAYLTDTYSGCYWNAK